jgi:hypothetical protein
MYGRVHFKNGAEYLMKNGAMFELRICGIDSTRRFKNTNVLNVLRANGIDPDVVSVNCSVFPPGTLEHIRDIQQQARKCVKRRELPIGFYRIHYIPKDCITEVVEELEKLEQNYKKAVLTDLIEQWENLRKEIKRRNPLLTDDMIPSKAQLEDRFSFDWTFFELAPPDSKRFWAFPKKTAGKIYKRIIDEYNEKMEQGSNLALFGLKEEMFDLLTHAAERLGYFRDENNNEKMNIFNASMIEKIKQFCEDFNKRDIFKDEALEEVVSMMEQLLAEKLENVVKLLRSDDKFRNHAREEMEKTRDIIIASIDEEKEGKKGKKVKRGVFIPPKLLEKVQNIQKPVK